MKPSSTDRHRPQPLWCQGIRPMRPAGAGRDVIAGVTLASLAIPEVLGYAAIAGMPVISGLYTMLLPAVIFALLGSSRHLVVGADSATAAIMAATLAGMAVSGSAHYVALAQLLALMTAALLLLARIVGLGFLADFLSRSVLIGFLTGVGAQVALSQLPDLLGLPHAGSGLFAKLTAVGTRFGEANPATVGMSACMLALIFGARAVSKRIPAALIAVVGAIGISWALALDARGVAVVGSIPASLPTFDLPATAIDRPLVSSLLPTAFAMSLVILAQSAATSRAYATKYDEPFRENADLVGLSLANVGAGLSGAFVVNGSPTKTAMAESAGARSQIAQITAAIVVLAVLLFLTAPLTYLPVAALAAVVFVIGIELIDLTGMRKLFREARSEFWVALLTAAVVLAVGVEQGIVLAVVLSLIDHTRKGYRPKNHVITRHPGGGWQIRSIAEGGELEPGLVVYRFSHSLYYANAELLADEVAALTHAKPPRWFCLDAAAVDDVDFSAGQTLLSVQKRLAAAGSRLVFVTVAPSVRDQLVRYAVVDGADRGAIFTSIDELVAAFRADGGRPTS